MSLNNLNFQQEPNTNDVLIKCFKVFIISLLDVTKAPFVKTNTANKELIMTTEPNAGIGSIYVSFTNSLTKATFELVNTFHHHWVILCHFIPALLSISIADQVLCTPVLK